MPNWVRNKLYFGDGKAHEVVEKNFTEDPATHERGLDFDTVDKMPEDLNIEYGSTSEDGLRLYLTKVSPNCKWAGTKEDKMTKKAFADLLEKVKARTFGSNGFEMTEEDAAKLQAKYKDRLQTVMDLGKKQVDNLAKYGAMNWYEWRCREWGCKWNASETSVEGDTIEFSTPWSPAIEAVVKLSKQHPDLRMAYLWADEEIGQRTGFMLLHGGTIDRAGKFKDGGKDAFKLAMDLWGCQGDYVFDEKKDTYVPKDEMPASGAKAALMS
jgi:hypothetical protein